ncbi:hypothetical protein ANN_16641 [Periplaneta americana]|uniref:Uncharacterized protein n=1 Tax=Periplaneta americana TaxID=6978 RepID=A0ABQ8SSD4_PERAM|nr:hypothetical protein ANN_16641 [Periplaneta americana]
MNLIVTSSRSSLLALTTSALIFFKIVGSPLTRFNPSKYVDSRLLRGCHSAVDSKSKKRFRGKSKLDPKTPSKLYIIYYKPLKQTNLAAVSQFVNNELKELGINEEKMLVLYSDAASYMLKAAGALSVYSGRQRFQQMDFVNQQKKKFWRAPFRMQYYKKLLLDVPLPPQPVITRWGMWIEAVNFFDELFKAVKSVVEAFSGEAFSPENVSSVYESMSAFEDSKVASLIAYITSHFNFVSNTIKELETSGQALHESMSMVEDATKKLNVVLGIITDEPREFNLPTLLQKRSTYVPEKLPSKYGVHYEEYLLIRTVTPVVAGM